VASKKSRTRPPAVEGELIRLTALQLSIIASIESGPKREQYGSRIIQDVADDLSLGEMPLATVYTALRRLEQRKMLTSRWGVPGPDGGNRRRFYRSTPAAVKAAKTMERVLSTRLGGAKGARKSR
jgi:DNA-binding PadR family transcriptional regulator